MGRGGVAQVVEHLSSKHRPWVQTPVVKKKKIPMPFFIGFRVFIIAFRSLVRFIPRYFIFLRLS
jgi:hypothetical protein